MSTLLGSILSVIRTDDSKFYFKKDPETYQDTALLKSRVAETAKLALSLSSEALQAIICLEFSKFDALIRNDGCQITAVQVCDIFKSSPPFSEAAALANRVSACAGKLLQQTQLPGPIDLNAILMNPEINPAVSLPISNLLRFYVLRKARTIKVKEGVEGHVTDANQLKGSSKVPSKILKSLVTKLQIEESVTAAVFVQSLNPEITSSIDKESRITTTPSSKNLEVCLNFFRGIALFSNKVLRGGERLEGVAKIDVAVSFPDGLVIDDVSEAPRETPVLFIEGTFLKNDPAELLCAAKVGRLIPFLLKQGRREEKNKVCSFKLDHFFCKSVREVVCEDSL